MTRFMFATAMYDWQGAQVALAPGEPSQAMVRTVLAELKRQELIRQIGLSNITPRQISEAQTITQILCVQNF